MFQNINEYYDDIDKKDERGSSKKEEIINSLKNIFSVRNIFYYIVCLGASMIGFGEGVSPFGLAILAATCSNKMPAAIVYFVCAIGTFIGIGKQGLFTYILTSLVFITFSLAYRPKYENTVRNEKRKLGPHLVASNILVQIMGIMFKTFYVYDLLTSILFTIVTYIFYKIFVNSITVIKNYGNNTAFTIEEVMGASLMLSIGIAAIGNFTILGFSIRNILCILIVLVLGWKNGILVGATGGITIGVVLGIIGRGDPMLIGAFALSGMIAGILNKFGKIGVIIGFFIGNVILTFVTSGNIYQIIYMREILIASIGLLLVPKNIDITITDLVGKTKLLPISKERMLQENEDTVYKLNSVSETISEISKSYKEAAATTVEESELEELKQEQKESFIDEVLANMENEKNNMLYDDIVNVDNGIIGEIYESILNKNEIHLQDIVDIFERRNCYIVGLDNNDINKTVEKDIIQIAKIANESAKINNINFAWQKQIDNNKKKMSIGLDGVSKVISGVAERIINKNTDEFEQKKTQIELLLLQKNIGVYDINITKQKNGKTIVDIYTKGLKDIADEAIKIQKIQEILSKTFNEKFILQIQKKDLGTDDEKIMQTYVSEDKLKATVAISNITKKDSEISGDSSLKLKLNDGKLLLALSDGMGSGKEANKASSTAIKMIKKLIGAGFEKEATLELINTSLAMKEKNEIFASLDISVLDLYKGNLEVLKNCACPTYLKRGKDIKLVHAISLPTGILNNVDSVVFDTDIKPDDIIIMCTDGVLEANKEAINKEEAFSEFLKQLQTGSVKKMADIIIKEAVDLSFGIPKDDMTVIVAKVEGKEKI